MSAVQLDLRRLEPGKAPRPEDVAAAREAESVAVRGPVPALAAVLTVLLKADRTALVPVAWEPAGDKDSLALARDIGVGTGEDRGTSASSGTTTAACCSTTAGSRRPGTAGAR